MPFNGIKLIVVLLPLFFKVLETTTKVMAPVVPYLAEEIHATWKADGKSVFATPWTPLVRPRGSLDGL